MKNNMFPKKKMPLRGDFRIYSGIFKMWFQNNARVLVPAGVVAVVAIALVVSGTFSESNFPGSGEMVGQPKDTQENVQEVVHVDDSATTSDESVTEKSLVVQVVPEQNKRSEVLARHEQYIASLRYKKHKTQIAQKNIDDRRAYFKTQTVKERGVKVKNLNGSGDVSLLTLGDVSAL